MAKVPNVGGYIRGPWWHYARDDPKKDRRLYAIAWGAVAAEPREQYKDLSMVRFAIKTGRGAEKNERHLKCVSYGEKQSTVIMRAMERGDAVFVAGTWIEKPQAKTKKGVHPIYELMVHIIIPMPFITLMHELFSVSTKMETGLPRFLYGLYMDDNLRKLAEKNADKYDEADPWEQED